MFKKRMIFVIAGALALGVGWGGAASAASIDPGFDLFHTPPNGAFMDLTSMGLGVVQMQGDSMGGAFGNTDTIVERLGPSIPAGGTGLIDIELVALNLVSIAPVTVGPDTFDVRVTQDPNTPSLGTMDIITHNDAAGIAGAGTFDSILNINALLQFVHLSGPGSSSGLMPIADVITSTGSSWSHTAPPDYPTPPGYPAGNFYPGTDENGNPVLTEHTGPHPEVWPATPEPASLSLLLLGGLLVARRRR